MTGSTGGNTAGDGGQPSGQGGSPPDAHTDYHIHDYDQSKSWQEIDESHHQHTYSKGALKPGLYAQKTKAAEGQLDHQTDQLAKDFDLKRSAPAAPDTYYPGLSHQELYDAVHKADPGQAHTIADSWTKVGNKMTKVPDDLGKAISGSESAWRGDAAEGARNAVAKIANQSGSAGRGAQLAGSLGAKQAEALSTARSSTPSPPEHPYDHAEATRAIHAAPDDATRESLKKHYADMKNAQDEEHRKAASSVQTYDLAAADVAETQPAFAPAPPGSHHGGGGDGGGGSTGGYPGGGPSGGGSIPHSGGSGGGGGRTGGGGGTGGGSTGQAPPTVPGTGGGTTGTDPSGSDVSPEVKNLPPAGREPGGIAGRYPSQGGGDGTSFPGGVPGGGGTGTGRGSGTGRGVGGRGAGAGSGTGGGGRSGSGRTGAGRGTGGTGEGARSPNGGGRTGAGGRGGAGGGAANEAGMGRGGTGAGRGGRGMGMMPRGGKGGKGEDDYEHNSPSWLIEPDKDSLFGVQEKTAPPVIGDWWGQYDPRRNSNSNQNGDGDYDDEDY